MYPVGLLNNIDITLFVKININGPYKINTGNKYLDCAPFHEFISINVKSNILEKIVNNNRNKTI